MTTFLTRRTALLAAAIGGGLAAFIAALDAQGKWQNETRRDPVAASFMPVVDRTLEFAADLQPNRPGPADHRINFAADCRSID